MMADLRELYQETILDHSKRPRNFHEIPNADASAVGHNPLCGDRVTVFLRLSDGVLAAGGGPSGGRGGDRSRGRGEPGWLLRLRRRGVEGYRSEDLPPWATFLRDIGFDEMVEPETVDDDGRSRPPTAVTPGLTALAASEDAYRVIRKDLEERGPRLYSPATA